MVGSGYEPARRGHSEAEIQGSYLGDAPRLNSPVTLVDYDSRWPVLYLREAHRIRGCLGSSAVRVEHIGSTAVPGLIAKPIIDVLLVVDDSADEPSYVPRLTEADYRLTIREPNWEQHRLFKGPDTNVNLHVYSPWSAEITRNLAFRDHLRRNASDRGLYADTKRVLAARTWTYVQQYADAKNDVIDQIMVRALADCRYDDSGQPGGIDGRGE